MEARRELTEAAGEPYWKAEATEKKPKSTMHGRNYQVSGSSKQIAQNVCMDTRTGDKSKPDWTGRR